MLREEAIEILQGAIKKPNTKDGYLGQAINMAIEALEQEPVLDKIKEIIDEWQSDTWTDNLSYDCMVKIAELVEPQESEVSNADSD